ncbi:MAG: hypothetical protein VB118_10500 [Oscillospiraceae bacterium]|nr:hypothetical protein [Oscillospiraceae bacterium]
MYNISADFTASCRAGLRQATEKCASLGIFDIDCGYDIGACPLYEADGNTIEDMRCILIDSCARINSITLPEQPLLKDELKKFCRAAHLLGVRSVILPAGNFTDEDRLGYIKSVCRAASSFGIKTLFENRADSLLCDNAAMTVLCALAEDGDIGFVFNPFEFVKKNHHPFFHMFYTSSLKNNIAMLRINDGLYNGSPTPLCGGNAEIKEMCSILLARSYDGYFSICPYYHEQKHGQGEDRYPDTLREFKAMLKMF